ncbi:Mobile element protein [Desulfurella amilsii]|uniref:Mobile element protein n=1 Tax=Desulfurella amilsii TaxID=1562698 RepID=A0A1X4XUW4_9BACT|nr:Mobile element protein [Desulfurella amilsii]
MVKNQHGFNDNFVDFAKTYKFIPKLCKPYRAQTKGKVERFNNYLKGNFYRPLKAKLKDNGIKYETSSIVITTNSSFIRLKEVFNDNEALTTAVLDRLIHHRLLTFRVKALG